MRRSGGQAVRRIESATLQLRSTPRDGVGRGHRSIYPPIRLSACLLLAACTPATTRPPFQPYPQAPALVINARPARVIAVLDSLVAAETLQVAVTSPEDGYLETAWYDTAAKTSHATWDVAPNPATTVKIRCWADPDVP